MEKVSYDLVSLLIDLGVESIELLVHRGQLGQPFLDRDDPPDDWRKRGD
jgi:hypothetical protein